MDIYWLPLLWKHILIGTVATVIRYSELKAGEESSSTRIFTQLRVPQQHKLNEVKSAGFDSWGCWVRAEVSNTRRALLGKQNPSPIGTIGLNIQQPSVWFSDNPRQLFFYQSRIISLISCAPSSTVGHKSTQVHYEKQARYLNWHAQQLSSDGRRLNAKWERQWWELSAASAIVLVLIVFRWQIN